MSGELYGRDEEVAADCQEAIFACGPHTDIALRFERAGWPVKAGEGVNFGSPSSPRGRVAKVLKGGGFLAVFKAREVYDWLIRSN